jgi:DNA polymerase-3 subunit epsilon
MLGLTANRVRALHADYVGTPIALAHRDGVVSDREREDLDVVAEALGVGGVEEALRRLEALPSRLSAEADATLAGKTACFTGALLCCHEGAPLTRERAERLAERAGLVVVQRVTKSLDVLVVADPNSMSGKAEKARQYGTRIVAETAFWSMIGVEVE